MRLIQGDTASSGVSTAIPPTYQHVVVRGGPYARGVSHGQQAKAKIDANIAHYKKPGKLPPWPITQRFINEVYIPGIKEYYPTALQELQGIADGAAATLEDIVMLNARYDLARSRDPFRHKKASASASAPTATSEPSNGQPTIVQNPPPQPTTTTLQDDDDANECTSAYFSPDTTLNGDVITAQNWDMSAHLLLSDTIIYLEVHPDPSESLPSIFVITEAGQLGRSGMNSAGLGVNANSLMSTDDYTPIPYTNAEGVFVDFKVKPLLPMSLLRRKFLECTNFAEALLAVNNSPRHVSNNLTVSTADGFGISLEITPDRIYKVYGNSDVDANYIIHTNHFTSPGFEARSDIRDRYPGGSSWFRLKRYEKGIRAYAKKGGLTEELITKAFMDHLSFPESLCQHVNESPDEEALRHLPGYPYKGPNATVCCVVYNLSQRKVRVCKGPPCQGVWEEFFLEGKGAGEKGVNGVTGKVDVKINGSG